MRLAHIIGSGPNGLAAAITLAQAGVEVTVFERNATLGGACSTAELTLPGFQHDLGASALPLGIASPFLTSLPLERHGLRWVQPALPVAHPLPDGTAVALHRDLAAMGQELDRGDGHRWTSLFAALTREWPRLLPDILGPLLHLPAQPLLLARFGIPSLLPAATLARRSFGGERARALFAGCAVHSVMPLTSPLSASVGMVLALAGHTTGWPVVAGGSGNLTNAMARYLETLGGRIVLSHPVSDLAQLPPADVTLFDTSPSALERIAGERLSPRMRRALRAFRHGPGVFKIDWALSAPIPWRAPSCRQAATVHVGGTLEEIVHAEAEVFAGRLPEHPFVLLVQPSVCDPERAPQGRHTAWGYTHVPLGSSEDRTEAIEARIEGFAPGFRDCILARRTWAAPALETWNPNLIGGDLSGGAMTPRQMLFRPTAQQYSTGNPSIYLCSSSTPPGGGVHGMSGHNAALAALHARKHLK